MDRNPSPPPPSRNEDDDQEEEVAGGDCIGSTVYSKHWLFGVLGRLIQIVSPENTKSSSDDEQQQMELDEEMENEVCRVWDMSMDEVRKEAKEINLHSFSFHYLDFGNS